MAPRYTKLIYCSFNLASNSLLFPKKLKLNSNYFHASVIIILSNRRALLDLVLLFINSSLNGLRRYTYWWWCELFRLRCLPHGCSLSSVKRLIYIITEQISNFEQLVLIMLCALLSNYFAPLHFNLPHNFTFANSDVPPGDNV